MIKLGSVMVFLAVAFLVTLAGTAPVHADGNANASATFTVKGKVFKANGKGLAGAHVGLAYEHKDNWPPDHCRYNIPEGQSMTTNGDGEYRFKVTPLRAIPPVT